MAEALISSYIVMSCYITPSPQQASHHPPCDRTLPPVLLPAHSFAKCCLITFFIRKCSICWVGAFIMIFIMVNDLNPTIRAHNWVKRYWCLLERVESAPSPHNPWLFHWTTRVAIGWFFSKCIHSFSCFFFSLVSPFFLSQMSAVIRRIFLFSASASRSFLFSIEISFRDFFSPVFFLSIQAVSSFPPRFMVVLFISCVTFFQGCFVCWPPNNKCCFVSLWFGVWKPDADLSKAMGSCLSDGPSRSLEDVGRRGPHTSNRRICASQNSSQMRCTDAHYQRPSNLKAMNFTEMNRCLEMSGANATTVLGCLRALVVGSEWEVGRGWVAPSRIVVSPRTVDFHVVHDQDSRPVLCPWVWTQGIRWGDKLRLSSFGKKVDVFHTTPYDLISL